MIVNGTPTVIDRAICAACCGGPLSATCTVKLEVPAVVGVPLIVAPVRVNPAGKLPEVMDQLSADVPPVAVRVWLYATPVDAGGNDEVVTASAGTMVSANAFWKPCAGALLSATRIVKFDVPAVVGVPVIVPPAVKLSPAGREEPVTTDQV